MEQVRDAMAPLLSSALDTSAARDELLALSERFGRALLLHIDAENSVLFPESEARFRRVNLRELPDRAPDADEEAARAGGERLAMRYPQSEYPGLLREKAASPAKPTACGATGWRGSGSTSRSSRIRRTASATEVCAGNEAVLRDEPSPGGLRPAASGGYPKPRPRRVKTEIEWVSAVGRAPESALGSGEASGQPIDDVDRTSRCGMSRARRPGAHG